MLLSPEHAEMAYFCHRRENVSIQCSYLVDEWRGDLQTGQNLLLGMKGRGVVLWQRQGETHKGMCPSN